MSFDQVIRMLRLRGGGPGDVLGPAEWRRVKARCAWVSETVAAWREAHREVDEVLGKAVDRMSEAEFERLCDAEFAKVDAMMAELRAAVDHDRWPRHLHWGGL